MKIFDPQVQMPTKVPQMDQAKGKTEEELREAAKQFEAMFLNLVIKQMRETVPENSVFGDSSKTAVFQGMLDEEYSKMAGQTKSYGLAEMIYQNLSKAQGVSHED
jgi:flagellar protein FlgJ